MDGFTVQKQWKFTAEVERTTTGKYRIRAKASGDTIQELDQNLTEVINKVNKLRIKLEEGNEK